MSSCRTIDPLVTPYVDGALADTDRRAVDEHLRACPPCHSRVASERAVREVVQSRRSALGGARPCCYGEGKIAHIMYRHAGQPVSLFMLPKDARAPQLVSVLGHQAKIWCVGDKTFVMIAREPRQQVERLAEWMQASVR